MGDRFDKGYSWKPRRPFLGSLKPPPEILAWGLSPTLGHNGGPPLDEPVNDAFVRYRWRKAHREAWKNPPHSIMMFRLSRARAAGVSYREYTAELLDTGRHMQAGDKKKSDEPST